MQPYCSYAAADGEMRCISGLTAYDEKFLGGRLVSRYLNACGQIIPEMHLPEMMFDRGDCAVFSLQVQGRTLNEGWRLTDSGTDGRGTVMALQHGDLPLRVEVRTHGDGKGWITRTLTLENTGTDPLPIDRVDPFCGTLWRHRFDNGILSYTPEECGTTLEKLYRVGYSPRCVWGQEGDFGFHPLDREGLSYNGGMNGRSGWSRPAFVLEDTMNGQMLCCELAYSGNWQMEIKPELSELGASLRFSIGLAAPAGEFVRVLLPEERVEVPAVHFTLCAEGRQKLMQSRHRFIREEILPVDPLGPCRIEANHRGYLCDRENEAGIILDARIAAKAGVELYVIDAGWYGKDPNIWFNNVGDWYAGSWLPNDLHPIIREVKRLGMAFGLWMEIEAAGPNSDIRNSHPEYFMKRHGEACADGRALDLSNPEVVDWVEDQVTQVISRYDLDMLRTDHNHYLCEGGTRKIGGYTENLIWRYYENLYAMLGRLRARFPQVSFQNCAAGGGRLDLGILRYFHHTEISDWARPPRDARIFNGILTQLPPEIQLRICGTEVCEQVQESDKLAQLHSIMQGRMIFRGIAPAMDSLADPLLEVISEGCRLYKQELRPILTGNCLVYRHTEQNGVMDPTDWSVNEYALPDGSAGFASILRLTATAGDSCRFCFAGLRPDRVYTVSCDRSRTCLEVSGRELMQQGLLLTCPNVLSSELVIAKQKP